jgi:hypothetical protein
VKKCLQSLAKCQFGLVNLKLNQIGRSLFDFA